MIDVAEIMLRRFGVLYGEPKTSDVEAFIAEYERALAGTSREFLEAATDRIVRSQDRRAWPTPGECVKAVSFVAAREYVSASSSNEASHSGKAEPKAVPTFIIRNFELPWDDWMKWLRARGQDELADAAEAAGTMTVLGSRWPKEGSAPPMVMRTADSGKLTRRMTGEHD